MFSVNPLSSSNASIRSGDSSASECEKYYSQWDAWEKEATSGSGEHRDVAVARMKECLINAPSPFDLDLSALSIQSLPPCLPPNGKLIVDKKMLEAYFNYAFENRASDKIVADFVDNYMDYFFENLSDDKADSDNYDFIREDIFDDNQLGLYIDPSSWIDFYHRVVERFRSSYHLFLEDFRESLIAFIQGNSIWFGHRNFNELKEELELCISRQFGKIAKRCAEECIEGATRNESQDSESE